MQDDRAAIAASVTPFNAMLRLPHVAAMWDPATAAGRAALDAVVTTQAVEVSYMDDFWLLMAMSLAAMPLVFLLRKPRGPVEVDHSAVME